MDKNKVTIRVLFIAVLVLVLFIIYTFAIRPAIVDKQADLYSQGYNQAQVDLLNGVLDQIQQTGQAQIPLGDGRVVVLTGGIATPQQ